MRLIKSFCILLLTGFMLNVTQAEPKEGAAVKNKRGLPICGYLEYISLEGDRIGLKAKLDTGADTCSANALDLVHYESDGKPWVRFYMVEPETNKRLKFELPVKRTASIKRHGSKPQSRYVVEMQVRVGYIKVKREFTLTDRSHYEFPILLGRNFLNGTCLVDSSITYSMGK